MKKWTQLVPEICPHSVDQRHKFSVETRDDGTSLTKVERNWCTKCLDDMDVGAALKWLNDNPEFGIK